jgi:hypothetical protein
VNRLIHICFGIICCLFLDTGLYAQTDASIKAAKKTVTDASGALKPYQKFIDNDSVHWLFGGDGSLSFRATSLTNWATGGEDQIGVSPLVNLFLNYKKGKRTFENYWTFAYGLLKTGENKAVKNDDRLYYTSKVGHRMSPKWNYTAAFMARTQFAPGYRYSAADTVKTSDFLAPVYLYLSIGLDYNPNKNISCLVSPVMGKATYANSNSTDVLATAGLITAGKDESGADIKIPHHSRYEFGGGLQLMLNGNLFKNKISYNSQVELFSNYAQKPENVDVFWALKVKIMLYKNITADLRFDLKYDDDQKTVVKELQPDGTYANATHGAKTQIMNYIGVGIFYQF